MLRANMAKLVSHMTERLGPGPDGKMKVFRNSAVSNLTEFLKGFDARNITDDCELTDIVDKARRLLEGVDPEVLRRSGTLRETVRAGFSDISRSLDSMVSDRPIRRIVVTKSVDEISDGTTEQIAVANGPPW